MIRAAQITSNSFIFKPTRLLGKNQYTSNVESGSTRTEIKHWVELFFGVSSRIAPAPVEISRFDDTGKNFYSNINWSCISRRYIYG
ncbi:hypothetical protein VitviT2T_022982 [Vitis vinifera]|uniref:Ribosomal protein L23 n=1 Tax=Vitis vinifera TaxID=29760 RepID=A0ABY9DCU8_VITVI|nr:hypothetical protein VitviT2T_022982 [Vitis vinifera]